MPLTTTAPDRSSDRSGSISSELERLSADRPVTAENPSPWHELPAGVRRIADAAVEAFAEHGYHATTTRDIANRAGMSPAALYVHFPSKSAVLGQISTIGHEASLRLVERSFAAHDDPISRLTAMAHDFTLWHAHHAAVAWIVHNELSALDPPDLERIAKTRRRIEQIVEAEIRRGVKDGVLLVESPRTATRAMLSLIVDVARWFRAGGRESAEQVADTYSRLALRMLGAHLERE